MEEKLIALEKLFPNLRITSNTSFEVILGNDDEHVIVSKNYPHQWGWRYYNHKNKVISLAAWNAASEITVRFFPPTWREESYIELTGSI